MVLIIGKNNQPRRASSVNDDTEENEVIQLRVDEEHFMMKPNGDSDIKATKKNELDLQETGRSTIIDNGGSIEPTMKKFYDVTRPWNPLTSEDNFCLAWWSNQSGQTIQYFANRLPEAETARTSAYSILKEVERMESGIRWVSWKRGKDNFYTGA